ncbi:flavodoxin family protein [Paucibacter sp. TC2R-5]|uniref:flavodoxin family protein n=1 Tax=Paucibacter sp. TC2R-5 TaxID=2893555 RepID=UPI0021E3F240|nr:flavodoxin family protein [Paucibacter sp. TC2R-5]MCV2360398.1 flavodoxin family protein [Paucibacter sp. TC2R-5]
MTSVFIVYHSATGTTAKLAEAIGEGASEVGSTSVYGITGEEIISGRFQNETIWAKLDQADAIIFGSPTFMGGPSAQFKAFADASGDRWSDRKWADKVAAGFTIGSNLNGDQCNTLIYFSVLAAQHGMIWCGLDIPGGYDSLGRNRLGTQMGVTAQSADGQLSEIDLVTARYLGKRVAQIAKRLASAHE